MTQNCSINKNQLKVKFATCNNHNCQKHTFRVPKSNLLELILNTVWHTITIIADRFSLLHRAFSKTAVLFFCTSSQLIWQSYINIFYTVEIINQKINKHDNFTDKLKIGHRLPLALKAICELEQKYENDMYVTPCTAI